MSKRIIIILISSYLTIGSAITHADSDLNLDFIQGNAKKNTPSILTRNEHFPSGRYLVDILFNNEELGKKLLTITPEESKSLCFSKNWIKEAHLPIDLKQFDAYFDAARQCYILSQFDHASINFEYGSQTLQFSIPQVALKEKQSNNNWDYGISGFRLGYSTNLTKSDDDIWDAYGNFNANINVDRWALSVQTSGLNGQGFNTSQASLSTAIHSIRGNLLIGKDYTASTLLPDFGYYGVAVRSDSNMNPWNERGYAPVISGVATTNARVTVTQGDYTLSSQIVPPGAYTLTNISPIGNGDLTVTVEEEDGTRKVQMYPVTTLPTLLRPSDFNYNFVVGQRDSQNNNDRLNGFFTAASIDYGFNSFTLNTAAILHKDYQGAAFGLTKDLGLLGAFSSSISGSHSEFNTLTGFNKKKKQDGINLQLKYAKSLSSSTNVQLLTYKYTGENYLDFSEFQPDNYHTDNSQRKNRYEAVITHNLNSSTYLSMSGWLQDYHHRSGNDQGASISLNTMINQISLSLNMNYGQYQQSEENSINYFDDNQDELSTSLSIGIPFSAFDHSTYATSTITHTNNHNTTMNTGVSGSLDDRVNYNLNSSIARDSQTLSAYVGVAFDAVQTGMSLSQQSSGDTSMSVSASGTIIGSKDSGILMTRGQNDTLAVVKVKDISGVTFNGSTPTNKQGYTVLDVTPYTNNDIHINTENIPNDTELLDSVYSVTPTEHAIIYREFKYLNIKRYILHILNNNGSPIPMGSQAIMEDNTHVGFVSQGGILLINALKAPKRITVFQQNGQQCHFTMEHLSPNTNKIIEVNCD